MKVKVSKQELRECITHAVIRALNESQMEEGFDEGKQITHPHALTTDELNALMDSDPDLAMAYLLNGRNMSKARQAAMADMSQDSSMNGNDEEDDTDYGNVPFLDAPDMSDEEIATISRPNDDRIQGVYDGRKYFPAGSRGFTRAFRNWVTYRTEQSAVEKGNHEGEYGVRPKDIDDDHWFGNEEKGIPKDPRNHGKMFASINRRKAINGQRGVGDTVSLPSGISVNGDL